MNKKCQINYTRKQLKLRKGVVLIQIPPQKSIWQSNIDQRVHVPCDRKVKVQLDRRKVLNLNLQKVCAKNIFYCTKNCVLLKRSTRKSGKKFKNANFSQLRTNIHTSLKMPQNLLLLIFLFLILAQLYSEFSFPYNNFPIQYLFY